jgi:GDSL-like Lipase/Acylhydrolase family
MAMHIVLLGDSIFDNRAYTGGAPDVVGQLRELLPAGWRATLCAVDGSTAADLSEQFADVPSDGSHVVISIGGNDALLNSDLLGTPVNSTAEALTLFGDRSSRFEHAYRAAINAALALRRDTTVCTIYNGNLEAREAGLARVALMMFNDVILRVAFERGLRVIDLRLVCAEAADYANPIEPSDRGGRKIAHAIARSLGAANGQVHPATVYAG